MSFGPERASGTLLGLAVGDALGAPLEGSPPQRASEATAAALEMTGGGAWAPGEWTDDTALALHLAESIAEHGLLDTADLARRYIRWATDDGKGMGGTTAAALLSATDDESAQRNARLHHEASGGMTAGNGTVMRCAPIALVAGSVAEATDAARRDATLTHFDAAAGHASAALCAALIATSAGEDPLPVARSQVGDHLELNRAFDAVERGDEARFRQLACSRFAAVSWTTLGIGLHALSYAESYEAGVSWAIGLGGDTDTNAAVAGALLGCRDGAGAIPERWLTRLQDRRRVELAAERLSGLGT